MLLLRFLMARAAEPVVGDAWDPLGALGLDPLAVNSVSEAYPQGALDCQVCAYPLGVPFLPAMSTSSCRSRA